MTASAAHRLAEDASAIGAPEGCYSKIFLLNLYMSFIAHYYHIVFRTYLGEPSIPESSKRMMFTYLYKIINNRGWKLIRINGYLNHVHILLSLPATVKVCDVVAILKSQSSKAFRGHPKFPEFRGWSGRYASLSVSYYEVATVRNYIINQESHHSSHSLRNEIEELFNHNGLVVGDFFDDSVSSV